MKSVRSNKRKYKTRRAELHAVTNELDAALKRIDQLEAEKRALEIENTHLSLMGPAAAVALQELAH